ncbi:hypothetical protein QFC19_004082 [Naganishia cerealis]|uniref:Uncharacterized protein n=1 Tax=Naganishia cerealis TaxID=610337 RepID=A0ACC2VZF8_9TREE|nr:hypothetical protein QFC19_004082 [Naganishia cerealis]
MVEYAQEAVKQGSAAVGLRSKTHAILLTLKRSTGELASYQKKIIKIDDHVGVAIAGLTSDARVLRSLNALFIPEPTGAQANTQQYGKRPYGVGFLVIGKDETGPHLFEFSPAGITYEYHAHSIGARSQSAKTYLEDHHAEYEDCSLDELIQHGLSALRDTLQQDKTLTMKNTSIAIIGAATSTVEGATTSKKTNFRVLDDEAVEPYLREMRRRRGEPESGEVKEEEEPQGDAQETAAAGGAPTEGNVAGASDGDGDVQMQE